MVLFGMLFFNVQCDFFGAYFFMVLFLKLTFVLTYIFNTFLTLFTVHINTFSSGDLHIYFDIKNL